MSKNPEEQMRYPELESSTVELKRELPQGSQVVKTMIGFCNQNGGKLVIGVGNNGDVLGLSDKEIEQLMEWIEKSVYEATTPSIIPRVYTQRFGDKRVLVIEVSSGMNKPYYRKSEGLTKGTYIRLGRSTIRATEGIIDELRWQSSGLDFERLPVYRSTKKDLSLEKIEEFLSIRKNHGKVKTNLRTMEAYHLLINEHSTWYPTVGGILLFGDDPQKYLSESMIICSHFEGNKGRDVIGTIDCEGDLFNQFHLAYHFILSRLTRSFKIKGIKRKESLEIPEIAVREALLNAIVHRNYHIKAPTKIAIYDNRVEIFSPGQFPGPIDPNNLKTGVTYLRNPAICKVLREAGYVEKLGSGFIAIFDSYEELSLPTPQIIEGEGFVKCTLPRGKVTFEKEKDDLDKVMDLFTMSDEISLSDVMNTLSTSRATATRKLQLLVKKGCIQRAGHTRAVRYRKN